MQNNNDRSPFDNAIMHAQVQLVATHQQGSMVWHRDVEQFE